MWLEGSSGRCFGLQPHIVSTGHGVHRAESWMILSEITIFDQLQTLPVLFIRDGGHMQVTSHMRCHNLKRISSSLHVSTFPTFTVSFNTINWIPEDSSMRRVAGYGTMLESDPTHNLSCHHDIWELTTCSHRYQELMVTLQMMKGLIKSRLPICPMLMCKQSGASQSFRQRLDQSFGGLL